MIKTSVSAFFSSADGAQAQASALQALAQVSDDKHVVIITHWCSICSKYLSIRASPSTCHFKTLFILDIAYSGMAIMEKIPGSWSSRDVTRTWRSDQTWYQTSNCMQFVAPYSSMLLRRNFLSSRKIRTKTVVYSLHTDAFFSDHHCNSRTTKFYVVCNGHEPPLFRSSRRDDPIVSVELSACPSVRQWLLL